MGFYWRANIKCNISNGLAFLAKANGRAGSCNGRCSECRSFQGVDITGIGEEYLDGSCCSNITLPPVSGNPNNLSAAYTA